MSEKLGIPYEPGGHCVFYAVQAANVYFNERGLTKTERDIYQRERERRVSVLKALTGVNKGKGGAFIVSVPMTLAKLEKYNIVPKEIICAKETAGILEGKNYVKRAGVDVRKVEEGETIIELPALLFTERDDQKEGHVWFCPDEGTFDRDYNVHIKEGDSIGIIVTLMKKES